MDSVPNWKDFGPASAWLRSLRQWQDRHQVDVEPVCPAEQRRLHQAAPSLRYERQNTTRPCGIAVIRAQHRLGISSRRTTTASAGQRARSSRQQQLRQAEHATPRSGSRPDGKRRNNTEPPRLQPRADVARCRPVAYYAAIRRTSRSPITRRDAPDFLRSVCGPVDSRCPGAAAIESAVSTT